MDLATVLTAVFVTLKLLGLITWSWWLVLAPLGISLAVTLVIVLISFLVAWLVSR